MLFLFAPPSYEFKASRRFGRPQPPRPAPCYGAAWYKYEKYLMFIRRLSYNHDSNIPFDLKRGVLHRMAQSGAVAMKSYLTKNPFVNAM